MQTESTIEGIIESVQRFRIVCVGCAGVGKSSLVNLVFGIDKASVSNFKPGESDIEQEFTSDKNRFFVLHDSKGFEPGNASTFNTVTDFITRRCDMKQLKDRVHAIWLCTKTPTAGGRVFEKGDENLLRLANQKGIPTVIVFTQYDKLVRKTKLRNNTWSLERAAQEALKELEKSVLLAKGIMEEINVPLVRHAKVSIHPGYDADVSNLVDITRDIVQTELKHEEWVMWAMAQRASLPLKIDACIDKGINYYHLALSGATPGVGKMLLRECLARVHQDIVTCWNIKNGEQILNSDEFRQLMLYLVEDVQEDSQSTTPPNIDKISNFVTLVTAASAPIAPPVAILGLSYFFLKWVSDAVLDNIPSVERLIMAYTVDLILVLKSYFDFTLMKPDLAGKADWNVIREAFEAYERTSERQKNHGAYRSAFQGNKSLGRDAFQAKIRELLEEAQKVET